jgi:hypothetical protein
VSRKLKPIPVKIVHDEPIRSSEYREPDSFHMSVRQITNGYLVSQHGWKDGKRFDHEVFSKELPTVPSGVPRKEQKRAPAPRPAAPARTVGGGTKSSSFMAVDMAPPPAKVKTRSPLNVPSDAALPRLKRLGRAKL